MLFSSIVRKISHSLLLLLLLYNPTQPTQSWLEVEVGHQARGREAVRLPEQAHEEEEHEEDEGEPRGVEEDLGLVQEGEGCRRGVVVVG